MELLNNLWADLSEGTRLTHRSNWNLACQVLVGENRRTRRKKHRINGTQEPLSTFNAEQTNRIQDPLTLCRGRNPSVGNATAESVSLLANKIIIININTVIIIILGFTVIEAQLCCKCPTLRYNSKRLIDNRKALWNPLQGVYIVVTLSQHPRNRICGSLWKSLTTHHTCPSMAAKPEQK